MELAGTIISAYILTNLLFFAADGYGNLIYDLWNNANFIGKIITMIVGIFFSPSLIFYLLKYMVCWTWKGIKRLFFPGTVKETYKISLLVADDPNKFIKSLMDEKITYSWEKGHITIYDLKSYKKVQKIIKENQAIK